MPLLARAKRRLATGLTSRALNADAKQTDLCAYLSAILLGGLALNALFGWWWADPIASALMTPIIALGRSSRWKVTERFAESNAAQTVVTRRS